MESMRSVEPTRPLAPYIGGKRQLAKLLVRRIEAVPHETYAEAFVGMAGVFLRRTRVPKAEVINDLNRDVATLFRVLQRHYVAFTDMIRWTITTRAEFERLAATDPETLTDLERSARFLYLQRTAFGGKVAGRNFGVSPSEPGAFDIGKIGVLLEAVHERLRGVVIECLPYGKFVETYDRPGTLFYLDPPYFGSEGDYGRALFSRVDFAKLAEQLAGLQGRFILSLNDVPAVRRTFADFAMEPVPVRYMIGGKDGGWREVGELIITNVPDLAAGAKGGAGTPLFSE